MTKEKRWWRRSVPWWARQRSPAYQSRDGDGSAAADNAGTAEGGSSAPSGGASPPPGSVASFGSGSVGGRSSSTSPARDELGQMPNINFSFFGNSKEDLSGGGQRSSGNPQETVTTFRTSVSLELGRIIQLGENLSASEDKIPEYAKVVKNSKNGPSLVEPPRLRSKTMPGSVDVCRDNQRYSNCFPRYEEIGSSRQVSKVGGDEWSRPESSASSRTVPEVSRSSSCKAGFSNQSISVEGREAGSRYSNCEDVGASRDRGYDNDDGPDYEELKVSPVFPETEQLAAGGEHYERLVPVDGSHFGQATEGRPEPPEIPQRAQNPVEVRTGEKRPFANAADKVSGLSQWTLRYGTNVLQKLRRPGKATGKATIPDDGTTNVAEASNGGEEPTDQPSLYEIPRSHTKVVIMQTSLAPVSVSSVGRSDTVPCDSGLPCHKEDVEAREQERGQLYGNADNAVNYSKELGGRKVDETGLAGRDAGPKPGRYTNITEDFMAGVRSLKRGKCESCCDGVGKVTVEDNSELVGRVETGKGGKGREVEEERESGAGSQKLRRSDREVVEETVRSVEVVKPVASAEKRVPDGDEDRKELKLAKEDETEPESGEAGRGVTDEDREEPKLAGKDPKLAMEDPQLAGEDAKLAGEDPKLAGEDPKLAGEDLTEPRRAEVGREQPKAADDCRKQWEAIGTETKSADTVGESAKGGYRSREGSAESGGDTGAYKSASRSPDGACWEDSGDYESLTVTSAGDYEDLEYCEFRLGVRGGGGAGGGVAGGRVRRTLRAAARWWRCERGRLAAAVERQAAAQAVGVAGGGAEAAAELVRRRRRARLQQGRAPHHCRASPGPHCCVPEGQAGFEELRRYIKQGGDFCKELSAILQERCEAETAYAKALGKLSGKLARASREAAGTVGAAWQAAGAQMLQQAEAHRALATSLGEEVVKPLRQLSEAQHRIRKSVESAVDKAGRGLSDWRHAQAKSKKASFAAARENERLQDSHLESGPTQHQPLHARLGHQLSDKEAAKLQQKRRKAEECVKRADVEYWGCCVRAERSRLEWEAAVSRAGRCLQALDQDRLEAAARLAGTHLSLLEQLAPRLLQSVARLREPVEAMDVQRDLRATAALQGAGNPLPEQLLPDFYAEHVTLAMNRDRRKQALVKLLQLIRQDLERERRGKQGVEQLARALRASASDPGTGAGGGTADSGGESVADKLHHARSMLAYLEAARFKVQGALLELEGRPRPAHPLAPHICVSRDRAGMQHSVLKVPTWVRDESVELLAGSGSDWPGGGAVSVVSGCDDRGAGDGNSVRPADSDFDEFSSQGSDERDYECGLEAEDPAITNGISNGGIGGGGAGKCRALYDYAAKLYDELNLAPGDVIRIHSKQADGWWLGELNGVVGIFPATYVEEID